MENENIIYWRGVPVGVDHGRWIAWFCSAPREAIEAYS